MAIITCWFSCGAASAVAAKKTIELYPEAEIHIVNNPVKQEHPDNLRFLKDCESWLGIPIEFATNKRYPNCDCTEVWEDRKYMSSPNGGAPCTEQLKKKAREQWEQTHYTDFIVLGFTAEEKHRIERFTIDRPDLIPVLYDLGITKQDCIDILLNDGIDPPEMYKLGYPNANCIGCVKATSPTYWNKIRKDFPKEFADRAEQSRRLGAKLARYKGERIFLDELPANARGQKMKSLDFECGIFCPSVYGETGQ